MCLMTPVYIAFLSLYHPRLNIATLRVTSTVGLILGFYNVLFTFGMAFRTAWWGGVIHLPLVFLSIYGLILSFSGQAVVARDIETLSEPSSYGEGINT